MVNMKLPLDVLRWCQLFMLSDRGGPSTRGSYNNDNNFRRNDSYDGGQNMRGGRNNFNGELNSDGVEPSHDGALADRGGGNRPRYGNFSDDNNRDDGFSGGRQNYGQQNRDGNNYGNREERFNNYGGNRGARGGGGSGGSGYEPERRTSESMSQLSLEGESHVHRWSSKMF